MPVNSGVKLLVCWMVLLAWLVGGAIWAQPTGTRPSEELSYFIQNYHPDDYGQYIQNWSIAEDRRGMIYIANNNGVMEYDGTTWRLIKLTDDDLTLSVASDSLGRIYAGGVQQIGYLALDDSGRLAFKSLVHLLPDSLREFSQVWSINILDGRVYYQASNQIMRWDPRTNQIKVWPGDFQFGIRFNNNYYVRIPREGLVRLENDEFKPVPGGDYFAERYVFFITPLESGRALVGTTNGVMLYDGKKFLPFPNEAEAFFRQHQPYSACTIDSGLVAVATITGGVVVLDVQGRWRQLFDRDRGLLSSSINYVYKSRSGGLWVATNYGIMWIDYPSPLTWYSSDDFYVQSIVRHNENLILGSIQGSYSLNPRPRIPAVINPIPGSPTGIWKINQVQDHLMISSEVGLVVQSNRGAQRLIAEPCYYTYQLTQNKRLAIATIDAILFAERTNGTWVLLPDTLKARGSEILSVIEYPTSAVIWAGSRNGVISKFDLRKGDKNQPKVYDSESDLRIGSAKAQDIRFIVIQDQLFAYTSIGLFRYDAQADRFVPDERFGERFTSGRWGISAIEADRWWAGRYWIAAYNTQTIEYRIFRATRTRTGDYEIERTRFGRIGRFTVSTIYSEPDGVLWVGTDKGLIRYDQKLETGFDQPFPALLRGVRAGNKPLFAGTIIGPDSAAVIDLPERPPFRIAYRDNTVRFEYAALCYTQPNLTEFQHRLLGFEEEWSDWTREPYKEYTNLSEGEYTFEVRARNVYGVVSSIASQRLVILPPWYRTWWAYSLFFVAFTGFIYGIFRWRLRALAEANRQLELKVQERTAEVVRQSQQLELQNQEIMRQKEEIEHQNQEITDSIKYASRIQEAILPSRVAISQAFPHSFVLYKPKDIVSGDFYWFAEEAGWRLIAAVDCTGHGIPGAFMSVLGSSLLNQIVGEKRITDPGTILNRLNELVRENLHQVDAKSESKDGMDLMLLAFPPDGQRMLYCGANNPLYLVRGGELTEFKAHKYPIGGGQYQDRHFETSELLLEPGDVLYIFSDGYADQFGGPNRRKFMYGKFKKLLVEIHQLPMAEQREALDRTIEAWRAESNVEQIDDILVIGLRPLG